MGRMLGKVDLLGLGAFTKGDFIGPGVSVLLGVVPSRLVGNWAVRSGKSYPGLWGLAAGAALPGALWSMKKISKESAMVGFMAAAMPMLIDYVAGLLSKNSGPTGLVQINPLGIPQVEYLNGLGLPTASDVPKAYGTIPGVYGPGGGVAGPQFGQAPPVDLLGQAGPTNDQVQILGGPQLHGLAAAYGATLLGSH